MKERITRTTLGDGRVGLTDWARFDAITEEQLEAAIAADPDSDIPNIDWTKARVVMPQRKDSIHMRIDPEVLNWYKQQGRGYLTRMHAVLRAYYEAHKDGKTK